MIVRILGEGQYDVGDADVDALNALDAALEQAVESGDEEAFRSALCALIEGIRDHGTQHELESLDRSDVIVPHAEATLAEVRDLLSGDGLIPG